MFPYRELLAALESDIAGHGVHVFGAPMSSDMSTSEIRCHALYSSFYKKLAPGGSAGADAESKALKKFLDINASISTEPFQYSVESEQDSLFWDYFRDNILKCLVPNDVNFDLEFIRETFAAGPGSSLFCDNESFYTKHFTSRITMTHPYLLTLYRGAISETDFYLLAERERDEKFGHEVVSGNRLFFVPKTAEILRTCCTEALVNMLIQKSLGAFLEKCLAKSFGVSLATQPDFNRELARIGSLDGSFGTIDLQSASDSISWSLIQRICPSNLLGYFRLARSERTILPDGSEIDLNMISTMGNGFTFPLQTIIFACAVRSVYQLMNLDSYCPKTQFGVFGDDIIVKREAYAFLVRSLTKLGFKVNDDKSFNSGPFRESCGSDWYDGHFVRGVYIKSLETASDVYSAINRLNRWSALSGVRLSNTVKFLLSKVKTLEIPFSEAIDGGIQVPFKMTKPKVDNSYWFEYRIRANRAKRRKVPESLKESRELNYKHFSEYGWAITYLGGFARRDDEVLQSESCKARELSQLKYPGAFMTLRDLDGPRRTKVVRRSIPYWDWLGPEAPVRPVYEWEPFVDEATRFFSYASWERSVASNR